MSTVVFNPTNEDFDAQYVGEAVSIPAGEKRKLDDPRARHILNELGPRGLCRLEYGDEEDKIAVEGKKRNVEFKKKQVMVYNQNNEARRQQNMSYMEIPEHVKQYANELGIGILEPYNIKDTEREELATLRAERDEDKKEMRKLQNMVSRLLEAQEKGEAVATDETPEETEIADNRQKYCRLTKGTLQGWVNNNKEKIGAWPEENQSEIRKKYTELYGKDLEL